MAAVPRVELRRGPWSPFQLDETYQYYNAAEHTPDVDNRYNQSKLSFTHTLGEGTFYSVKAARQAFDDRVSVQGKDPWEYEGDALRDLYFDYENSEQSSFFVRGGDYPSWSRRKTKVYSGRADLTHQWNKHTFETGVDFRYKRPVLQRSPADVPVPRRQLRDHRPFRSLPLLPA